MFRCLATVVVCLLGPGIVLGDGPPVEMSASWKDPDGVLANGREPTSWMVGEVAPTGAVLADAACAPATCVPPGGAPNLHGSGWLSHSHDLGGFDEPLLACLKDRPIHGGKWTCSVGGQLRFRWMDERFRLRPFGADGRDTYQLWRFTPYLEIKNDWFTGFVQAIDASSFGEELPPVAIDVNRSDLLQYYADLRILDWDGRPVRLRYGRQFLKYGVERLVSPLPWGNTYRNFEGFKTYYAGDAWTIDAFATQPVNGAAGNTFRPVNFDTPDQSRWFSGVYATNNQAPFGTLDLYWLWLNENEPNLLLHDGRRHTLGARYAGRIPVSDGCRVVRTWTWDLEGGWQFGTDDFESGGESQDVSAGYFTAEGSLVLDAVAWKPTLKGLFWWGSGDDDPDDGEINTVTTLFPLGHAYWGLIDNFNGGNLLDYSIQGSVKPHRKLTFLTAWHWFDKASTDDFIYNVAGAPLGPVDGDRNIGQELDLVATYALRKDLSIQAGYFWFWYGDAVNDTDIDRPDAEQFYLMTTWNF